MSKSSLAIESLPPEAFGALAALGENLALARVRRNESQRKWAQRLGVSVPTLIKMERGDPSVSIGAYATALWMVGLVGALGEIARPEMDLRALEADVRKATTIRAVRGKASAIAQAGKSSAKKTEGAT